MEADRTSKGVSKDVCMNCVRKYGAPDAPDMQFINFKTNSMYRSILTDARIKVYLCVSIAPRSGEEKKNPRCTLSYTNIKRKKEKKKK